MNKEQILKKTISKLHRLDEHHLQEAEDFVDFLLTKISDKELTKEIQKQSEESKAFAFLNDEEELYSIEDLKEVNEE